MTRFLSSILYFSLSAGAAIAQTTAQGEAAFKSCAACHQVGDSAKNRLGPVLNGVVGRPAGSFEGYKYSASMAAAGEAGLIWSEENIAGFITDPTGFLREFLGDPKARSKMTFKQRDAAKRQDVIVYLATFQTAAAFAPADGFCVVNASQEPHLFSVETREGARQLASLDPGEQLCASDTSAPDGIVSVFEAGDSLEGCSRIVPVGRVESMLKFAGFDACGWSSQNL